MDRVGNQGANLIGEALLGAPDARYVVEGAQELVHAHDAVDILRRSLSNLWEYAGQQVDDLHRRRRVILQAILKIQAREAVGVEVGHRASGECLLLGLEEAQLSKVVLAWRGGGRRRGEEARWGDEVRSRGGEA